MRAKTAQTNNHRFIVETESVPELLIDSVSLNDSTTLYHDRQNPHNGKALVAIMSSVWLYVRRSILVSKPAEIPQAEPWTTSGLHLCRQSANS